MKNILIQTCCSPCLVYIYEDIVNLKEIYKDDAKITSYFFNPNIHPKVEFTRRLNALKEYCGKKEIDLVVNDKYDMKEFLTCCLKEKNRCDYCYNLRMEETFKYAKENNFDAVMTTLSISPYQNQELIKNIGDRLSLKYGIEYIHLDYKVKFREGQKMARTEGLYMQKYCGCALSMDAGRWVY